MNSNNQDRNKKRGYLDRDIPPSFIDEWTQRYSKKIDDENHDTESFVVFSVSDIDIAISTKYLIESFNTKKLIHSVPGRTNEFFLGLANVNGTLVMALNINYLLNIGSEQINQNQQMLYIGLDNFKFLFAVDRIIGEFKTQPNQIEEIPENVINQSYTLFKRRIRQSDANVLILDNMSLSKLIDEKLQK